MRRGPRLANPNKWLLLTAVLSINANARSALGADPQARSLDRRAKDDKHVCLEDNGQTNPERDGVIRPEPGSSGGGGAAVALLPRTGVEHHASALVNVGEERGGKQAWELLAAWFSGVEGSDTVTIFVSRLREGGASWSVPQEVARDPGSSLQNPVWLWDRGNGLLRLLYTSQRGLAQETSRVLELVSRDRGQTWSPEPRVVFEKPGSFIKSPPLLWGAEWLLPMYHTPKGASKDIPSQYSELRRSADSGETWGEEGLPLSSMGQGLVQPDAVQLPDGRLVVFFRQRYSDDPVMSFVWRSESPDGGHTWSSPAPTPLPNPNKHVQACVLPSGAILLVFNNNRGPAVKVHVEGVRRKVRVDAKFHPLSAALSYDGGLTWPFVRDLEEQYDARLEYSYPSVLVTADGWIHITHTWSQTPCRRCAIRYHRISEGWVKGSWSWGATRGVYKPPQAAAARPLSERMGMVAGLRIGGFAHGGWGAVAVFVVLGAAFAASRRDACALSSGGKNLR